MRKTEVLFFFDTEDFTCDESIDAAVRLADIMTEEGVTGHFAVVGLLAKRMAETRPDAIEALNRHEIGSHTYGHSLHPAIAELSDGTDYDAAYARVAESEGKGLDMIRRAFGRDEILFAVPPGNSKSYVAMYYYASQGIPFYCDNVVGDDRGSDVYCANMQQIQYSEAIEGTFAFGREGEADRALNRMAEKKRVIVYTHPNMAYFSEFWDMVNFNRVNKHPDGCYEKPAMRSRGETESYFAAFRALLRAVKADDRFEITTLRDILSRRSARRPILRSDIGRIYDHLQAEYAPMTDEGWSLYDLLKAAALFAGGAEKYVPADSWGLLTAPHELPTAAAVSALSLEKAAGALPEKGFLPADYNVDGVTIGVGDLLYGLYELLTHPGDTVTLRPHPVMTLTDRFPQLRDMALKGTWLHSDDFRDECLSRRLRLQMLTVR